MRVEKDRTASREGLRVENEVLKGMVEKERESESREGV